MATVTKMDYGATGYAEPKYRDKPADHLHRRERIKYGRTDDDSVDEVYAAEKAKSGVGVIAAVMTALGIAAVAVLLAAMLISRSELAQISAEAGELMTETKTLQEEQTKLRVKYESTFDLKKIESYAINELGMTALESSQISYIGFSAPDHAVILSEGTGKSSKLLKRLKELFSSAAEYLR